MSEGKSSTFYKGVCVRHYFQHKKKRETQGTGRWASRMVNKKRQKCNNLLSELGLFHYETS